MPTPALARFRFHRLSVILAATLSIGALPCPGFTPPADAELLFAPDDLPRLGEGARRHGHATQVAVEGPDFEYAVRLTTERHGYQWDVEVGANLDQSLRRGQVLLLRFTARMLETRHESGQGIFTISVAETTPPHQARLSRLTTVGADWEEFWVRAQLPRDFDANSLRLKISAGQVPQTIELGGIALWALPSQTNLEALPQTRTSYAGREADASWRAEAVRRIEAVRMAPLVVEVIGRDGRPLPGAVVHAVLERHAFDFGTAVSVRELLEDSERGAMIRRRLPELFNAATFFNALKWQAWAGDWGGFSQETTLEGLRWMQRHGLDFRGHVLVWPSWHNSPRFLRDHEHDPAALQRLILAHIDEITSATAPYVSEWDVINEPRDNRALMDICGREVMIEWFQRARHRLPDTRLALNDYAILTTLADGPTQEAFAETAAFLIEGGAPLDVFGFQGHFGGTVPPPERVLAVLDRFAAFERPIRITEFTMSTNDQELRHDFTRDFLTVLYSHPSVIGFQMWGLRQAIDDNGALTPLGRAYSDLVHGEWKTQFAARTDAAGRTEHPAHLGRYRITITHGNRKLELPFELKPAQPPLLVTLP
ncbi:MAG: hypothetical protein EA425_05035 [Puniceicoccaceae bacterium]|nr:MAG: hypothetical protein EA425_05035 [Puniceicoccaceae bacterium]